MSSLSSAVGTGPSRNCGAGPGGAAVGAESGDVGVSSAGAAHSGNRLGDDVAVWNVSSVLRVEFGEARGSKLRLRLKNKCVLVSTETQMDIIWVTA